MEDSGDVTCKLVCDEKNISGKNSAFLAMFSTGFLKKDDAKKIQFRSYENAMTPDGLERKRTRKILVADSGKLQYCGLNYGTQASQRGELCRYYVGVRNRRTGMMSVHGVQLVHCKPLLNTTVLEEEDDISSKTYIEKMDLLTSAFGTKRKQQAMENRLNYTVGNCDEGNTVADSIELSDLKKNNTSTNLTSVPQKAQAIPPQNASATTADQVYDLKDIISIEEYFALDPLAKDLTEATSEQKQQWKNDSTYGQLVLQNLQDAETSIDLNKAKLLVYYNFLIQLLKLHAAEIKRKDPLPNVPEPFKRKLLERFTLSGSTESGGNIRTLPLAMKDKVMTYAMVLALFIEDFRIELPILQNDFKKGQPALTKIANALGCSVINQKKNGLPVKVAELKLPLFVPTGKTFGKKR